MRIFTLMMILLLASCVAQPSFAVPDYDVTKSEMIEPSVQIENNIGACSATIISSEDDDNNNVNTVKVLTAKHCFENQGPSPITFEPLGTVWTVHKYIYVNNKRSDDITFQATLCELSNNSDIAMLCLETTYDFAVANIALPEIVNDLKFGEQVWSVSFPFSIEQSFVTGFLEHIIVMPEGSLAEEFQFVTIPIAPGSSGSALYVLRNGHYYIIGTLTSYLGSPPDTMGLLTQYSTLTDLLEFLN